MTEKEKREQNAEITVRKVLVEIFGQRPTDKQIQEVAKKLSAAVSIK